LRGYFLTNRVVCL